MPRSKGPTVKQLRAECKARGLKRYSRLRKAELIAFLIASKAG